MNTHSNVPTWTTIAILAGRLIFARLFIMAGLLFAAVHGPGRVLAIRRGLLRNG